MAFILIINWYLSGLIRNPGNRLELLELQELLGTPQQSVGGTQQGTPGTPWNSTAVCRWNPAGNSRNSMELQAGTPGTPQTAV